MDNLGYVTRSWIMLTVKSLTWFNFVVDSYILSRDVME